MLGLPPYTTSETLGIQSPKGILGREAQLWSWEYHGMNSKALPKQHLGQVTATSKPLIPAPGWVWEKPYRGLRTTLQGKPDPVSPLGTGPQGKAGRQQPPSCPFCGISYWQFVSRHCFLGREMFAGEMKLRPSRSRMCKMPLKLSAWVSPLPTEGPICVLNFQIHT